jgi:hypothetical protein
MGLPLTPISFSVDVETLCPKHDCRLNDYDLSNSSSLDLTVDVRGSAWLD